MKFKLVLAFVFISFISRAQDLKVADQLLSSLRFEEALEIYLEALNSDEDNIDLNYKTGVCYLNLKGDKTKAIPYLEKVVDNPKHKNNANYLLGRAYHFASRFEDAKTKYYDYLNQSGGTAASTEETKQQIQYCENAKELMKYPLDVTFENLGEGVNTIYSEYNPFVTEDESFLVFNSDRNPVENGKTTRIYHSFINEGNYSKAKEFNEIDENNLREEIVGMTSNGMSLIYYVVDINGRGNLYISNHTEEGKYEEPVKLDDVINSSSDEISACISEDGNSIFFASNRDEGIDLGGTDLYISVKLPIGGWGYPQNLGPEINTPYDEDFPQISPDGKTLYFSSKGHTSMGGYDIFKAEWMPDSTKFGIVRNIGYPINTPYDDMNLRMSKTGRYGYKSAVRPEGKGDLDIYRLVFNEVETEYSVVRGIVKSEDGLLAPEDVYISVIDNETGDLFGEYIPNPRSKRYVMILPPGSYNMSVEAAGYQTMIEDIEVLGKGSFEREIDKNLLLKK